MKIRFIVIVLLCLHVFSISSNALPFKFSVLSTRKINLLDTVKSKNCFITYVMIDDNMYIVKQKKKIGKQLSVVRDALAAYIAHEFSIAHQLDIIPHNKMLPGKIRAEWPAVIITIAPGDTVRKQTESIYNKLRLRQWWAKAPSFQDKGLTRDIITQMTWHKQLPLIVALDLFIGNSDRHCGNLFYEPETDSFCAIDMDDTFNKDLCALACKKLLAMVEKDKVSFSTEEKIALNKVKNCLSRLVTRFKPKELIKKLNQFASKAGFVPGTKIYNKSIKKRLQLFEEMITKSHASAYQLISLLGNIVATG